VILGYQAIKCGDSTIVVAGGQESMSNAPHVVNVRSGIKMGNTELMDTMLCDGLTDAFNDIHMGITGKMLNSILKVHFTILNFINIILHILLKNLYKMGK